MKITNINLKNFLHYRALDLDLPEKISLFAGANGSGKSTLLDGIRACLTGTARNCPRKDSSELARWGTNSWSADLTIGSGKTTLHRTATTLTIIKGEVKQTLTQGQLGNMIKDPSALDAVLDVWKALDMSPSDRKALIFRLAGIDVTEGQLREAGLETTECIAAALAGDWKKAERLAAESKRAAGRVLKDHRIPEVEDVAIGPKKASEISNEKLEGLRGSIRQFKETERDLAERIARAKAIAEVSTADLEARRAELIAEAKEIGSLQELENRHGAIRREIKAREETIAEAKKGITKERETLRQANDAVVQLLAKATRCEESVGEHECEVCGLKHTSPGAASPKRILEAKTLHANAVKRAEEQAEIVQSGESFLETVLAERDKYSADRVVIADLLERRARIDNDIAKADAAIAKAGERAEDPTTLERELDATREKIEKGHRILEAVGTYRRADAEREAAEELKKALEDEVEKFARQEQLLRPDGLQTELLAPARKPISDRLSLWSQYVGFDLVLTDDFDVRIALDDGGSPVSMLSTSERWRVALALADALAQLSGLRFLALDEVPWPDPDKRNELYKALVGVAGDYDQIVVCVVLGDRPPKQSKNPDLLRVYLVSGGKVEPVPAEESAEVAA